MSKLRNLFLMIGKSLNPGKYHELNNTLPKNALAYFFTMVLFSFLIMSLLFIPHILSSKEFINEQINKFDELSINIEYDQSESILIPEKNPLVIFDTINNHTDLNEGVMLISSDATYYRLFPFGKVNKIEDSKNLLEKSNETAKFISLVIIMMIPMLMAFAYVYFTLKFLFIAIIIGVLGFIFVRIARLSFDIGELIKMSLYASTIMVMFRLFTKPFVPDIYYLDIVLFALFFIIVMIKTGEFEEIIKPESKKRNHSPKHNDLHFKNNLSYHKEEHGHKEQEIGLLRRG